MCGVSFSISWIFRRSTSRFSMDLHRIASIETIRISSVRTSRMHRCIVWQNPVACLECLDRMPELETAGYSSCISCGMGDRQRRQIPSNSYPAGIDNIWQQTWWPHEKLLLLYRFCMILWRKSTGYCNAIASIQTKCTTFCLDLRSKTMPEKRKHEEVRMETTSPSCRKSDQHQ